MRDRYDATFNGKKSRKVKQSEIDDHVVEAHGPDSAPRRTSSTPPSMNTSADFPPVLRTRIARRRIEKPGKDNITTAPPS
jgi:hypothetical protein